MNAAAARPVVETRGIEKFYGASAAPVSVLRAVDLSIQHGEMVALRGPSGSGKSTLLNILGCLDRPTRGTYTLGGYDVSTLDRTEQAYVRLHYIGFVFQSCHLLPRYSALENVMLPLHYAGVSRDEQRAVAARLLERVGLGKRFRHLPSELSGGERQRVAIARALACRPRLLLADEPTGALDTRSGAEILQLISEIRAEDELSIVLVTHDPNVAARADRQVHLLDGRIVDDAEAKRAGPS